MRRSAAIGPVQSDHSRRLGRRNLCLSCVSTCGRRRTGPATSCLVTPGVSLQHCVDRATGSFRSVESRGSRSRWGRRPVAVGWTYRGIRCMNVQLRGPGTTTPTPPNGTVETRGSRRGALPDALAAAAGPSQLSQPARRQSLPGVPTYHEARQTPPTTAAPWSSDGSMSPRRGGRGTMHTRNTVYRRVSSRLIVSARGSRRSWESIGSWSVT